MSPPRQLRRRQDLAARKSAWGWRSDRRPASCGQFRPPRATARRSRSRSGDVDGDVANAAAPGNGDNEGLRNRILQAARNRGLDISCKWFGPVFRVTASVNCPALGASPTAVGYISGFTGTFVCVCSVRLSAQDGMRIASPRLTTHYYSYYYLFFPPP